MDDANVFAALEGAVRDEDLLLRTFSRGLRDGPGRRDVGPRPGTPSGEVTSCYACGGPVEMAGGLYEEGGLSLLTVWWCPVCCLAFDDASIAAPERGRAPLTPGYNWYGRWRFRPAP